MSLLKKTRLRLSSSAVNSELNEGNMTTGFLITSLTGVLKRINDVVNQHMLKTLYVQVYLKKLQTNAGSLQWISNKIVDVYSSTCNLYPNLDVRIILNELKRGGRMEEKKISNVSYDVDVIILPKNYKSEEITSLICSKKNVSVIELEDSEESEDEKKTETFLKVYENVVLGGTFDRLHAGHKILLSQALLQCSNSLTVGVTDCNMIKSKILWELIEPTERRIEKVKKFLKEVDNTVHCNVVEISDMYGPTKSDPNFNMIVVSTETQRGGHKINQYRKEHGLSELEICAIDIVEEGSAEDEEETKISSSNLRKRLLGTRIRDPQPKPELPSRPYIIGLTGGICSGKSSIGEYLKTLGAALIDCDKIAHQLYRQGTRVYDDVIKTFGKGIVGENKEIDRRKLGAIVFGDPVELETLNQLLWPKIMEEAMVQGRKMYSEQKKDIVVLEAAVLLRAGWHSNVHEVWTSIIPPEEAIHRLMNRNKLTEEEATRRLTSQPSNSEQVAIANVVFCSLWSYEYTQKQVQRAWKILNDSLKS